MKQTWIPVISRLHTLSAVYISTARSFHMYMDLAVLLISVRKLHDLPFILSYELNSVRVNPLIAKGDG
jgi:hypothetical protein